MGASWTFGLPAPTSKGEWLEWGRRLAAWRKSVGLGKIELGTALGEHLQGDAESAVNRSTIYRWERGLRAPRDEQRAALEKVVRGLAGPPGPADPPASTHTWPDPGEKPRPTPEQARIDNVERIVKLYSSEVRVLRREVRKLRKALGIEEL